MKDAAKNDLMKRFQVEIRSAINWTLDQTPVYGFHVKLSQKIYFKRIKLSGSMINFNRFSF